MSDNVLVMIPAYDEERTIRKVVMTVRDLYPEFDVLLINDGSTDGTGSEAESAGATVLTLPFHAGGTAAVLTGYLVALRFNYDYLVKVDGDGQHKPDDIARVLQPLFDGLSDIAVGSRYLRNKPEQDSMVRIGGRVFSSTIFSRLSKQMNVTDVTSGFRAWRREALRRLVDIYMSWTTLPDDSVLWLVETTTAIKEGLRIKEVPIEVLPRTCGKSKSFTLIKMLKYPFKMVYTLFKTIG